MHFLRGFYLLLVPSLNVQNVACHRIVDLVGTMGVDQISSMMVALDKTPLPQGVKPYFQ